MTEASSNPALEQFIRSIRLFADVPNASMPAVLRLLRPVTLDAGQKLFTEGELGRAMWVLGTGCEVTVMSGATGGNVAVAVAYAREGEVLGEMALVDDGPRSGSATVVQGGPAHEIDAQEFHSLRDSAHPAAFCVLRQLCMGLCERLRATNERIVPSVPTSVQTPALKSGRRASPEMLEGAPAFKSLPATVKLALSQKLELFEVNGVTPLFAEGEAADGVWFLLEGELSVGRNGKTLAHLEPGSMFGVVAAIDRGPRSASCVTTGAARLLKLNSQDFDQLFDSGHRFAFQLVDHAARQLVTHLRQANHHLPLATLTPVPLPRPPEVPPSEAPGFSRAEMEVDFPLDEIEILSDD